MGNNLDFSQKILGRNGPTDTISSILALNQAKSLDSKKAKKRYRTFSVPYGTYGTRVKIRYCTVKYGTVGRPAEGTHGTGKTGKIATTKKKGILFAQVVNFPEAG